MKNTILLLKSGWRHKRGQQHRQGLWSAWTFKQLHQYREREGEGLPLILCVYSILRRLEFQEKGIMCLIKKTWKPKSSSESRDIFSNRTEGKALMLRTSEKGF